MAACFSALRIFKDALEQCIPTAWCFMKCSAWSLVVTVVGIDARFPIKRIGPVGIALVRGQDDKLQLVDPPPVAEAAPCTDPH
ncbi:hypothetical protein GCM10007872_25870 [Gluconobacter sphaericus NBRC 12467]|uniref:Uncharacterized protein n=1 Tax=Gluconobacter sphaericus NBRC 12467 TaxID=1307951 RepID=A0AA37SL32_9PROT|nr:hypothetical protein GSP01_25340 [Gluconobacter sphaericus NBRC 12467]GLQ85677.1 hypothetical protein GCM10007872_25870 [Gluconobacter sphaericus NBRC 12467]